MLLIILKVSLRTLLTRPVLSVVKVIGLAIGMATFLLSALYWRHEISFDRQHPGSENIYRYVHRVKTENDLQSFAFTSATTGPALKERFSEVLDFSRVLQVEASLKRKDSEIGFVEKKFAFADGNFLEFFSFPLRDGQRDVLKEPLSVIVTPATALKYFGDEDPIGQTLLLNGAIELVVKGVFESNFTRSHMKFDFVASFATLETIKNHPAVSRQIPASLNLEHKGFNAFYTYLKLTNPGASKTLESKFPAFIEEFRGQGRSDRLKPFLQSLQSIHLESDLLYELDMNGSRSMVVVYVTIGVLILITSIINYVNISTAEFVGRARTVGLKKILGIGRSPLLLAHLIETGIVCWISLMLGGVIALASVAHVNSIMNADLEVLSTESLIILLIIFLLTVVLSGFLPAAQIIRQNALIAFQGQWRGGYFTTYLRNSLVFVQLAASFVLLTFAFLIAKQTDYLLTRDTGFDSEQVMVLNAAGMPTQERLSLRDRLSRNNTISSVSMCSIPPGESLFTFGLTLPGTAGDEDRRITFYHMFVDENFLEVMGVKVIDGRFFHPEFPGDSLNALVVNETGAESIHDSLMSRDIEIPNIFTGKPSVKKVVGVISDFHFASFHNEVHELVLECNPRYTRYLLIRFHPSNAQAVVSSLENIWKEFSPLLPLHFYFMDQQFAKAYETEYKAKAIISVIAVLAIVLASLGIFGTSLFTIQQRTREIGIRKLLGSATTELFALLVRPMILVLLASCAFGLPVVIIAADNWLTRYPYHIELTASLPLISFVVILLVMLITVSFYVVRIMRVQPAEVLRGRE